MKITKTALAATAMAFALSACGESPAEERADMVEDQMEDRADALEDQGVITDDQADAMEDRAEATADAIEEGAGS